MIEKVRWLGHASFRIDSSFTIYFDPWKIKEIKPADIIFISHDHYDHCSTDDVRRLATDKTKIVAEKAAAQKLKGIAQITSVEPGDEGDVGVRYKAVPAYNTKPERQNFHPKDKRYVGFIVEIEGVKIYHPGDTDFIPEMRGLEADIALIPVGGTYTMDWKEAVDAVNSMRVKIAVPMHWGDIVGSKQDAIKFKDAVKTEVRILG